jgi:predicted O-methyltransferase YrrM
MLANNNKQQTPNPKPQTPNNKQQTIKPLYSPFTIAKKYLSYWLNASNKNGHGVHSPFVFDLIINVFIDRKKEPCFQEIESIRQLLKDNHDFIEVEDFGAGSAVIKSNKRKISKIANSSLKSPKYAQLLYRLVKYFRPKNMIELGTSFGITSAYLAKGNPDAQLYTFEGASSISNIAENNLKKLGINNVELINGDFGKTLPPFLEKNMPIDFAFIDGNHREKPTIAYFESILSHCNEHSILVFDDIHWSEEMEIAWDFIKNNQSVTMSVDLFFIGLVFFRKDFKEKQHFAIQF